VKLATNIHRVSGRCSKRFSRLKVRKIKVICVEMCECYNGGGIHFDVVLRLTCFFYLLVFCVQFRRDL